MKDPKHYPYQGLATIILHYTNLCQDDPVALGVYLVDVLPRIRAEDLPTLLDHLKHNPMLDGVAEAWEEALLAYKAHEERGR